MDKRIIEKKLRSGRISKEELKPYFDGLPDVAENAEECIVEMERKKKK